MFLFNYALSHEEVCRSEGIFPSFLTPAVDGGGWLVSILSRFIITERSPGTHRVGKRLGPNTGLDVVENRNVLTLPEVEKRPSNPQPVSTLTELSQTSKYSWRKK
jgi:hypothetical protein